MITRIKGWIFRDKGASILSLYVGKEKPTLNKKYGVYSSANFSQVVAMELSKFPEIKEVQCKRITINIER